MMYVCALFARLWLHIKFPHELADLRVNNALFTYRICTEKGNHVHFNFVGSREVSPLPPKLAAACVPQVSFMAMLRKANSLYLLLITCHPPSLGA